MPLMDREAQDEPGAVPIEQRADQRGDERGQQPAERHGTGNRGARPSELLGQWLDEDREGYDGWSLPRDAGAAEAGEDDPAVVEGHAGRQRTRKRSSGWPVFIIHRQRTVARRARRPRAELQEVGRPRMLGGMRRCNLNASLHFEIIRQAAR